MLVRFYPASSCLNFSGRIYCPCFWFPFPGIRIYWNDPFDILICFLVVLQMRILFKTVSVYFLSVSPVLFSIRFLPFCSGSAGIFRIPDLSCFRTSEQGSSMQSSFFTSYLLCLFCCSFFSESSTAFFFISELHISLYSRNFWYVL